MDRTYFRLLNRRTWHGWDVDNTDDMAEPDAYCGVRAADNDHGHKTADRLPPNGHLCGNCARIIAARTDIEELPPIENDAVPG